MTGDRVEFELQILFGAVAFLLGCGTDFIWCKWMENVAHRNPLAAAIVYKLWIVVLMDLAGGYLGTYWAVKKSVKEKTAE